MKFYAVAAAHYEVDASSADEALELVKSGAATVAEVSGVSVYVNKGQYLGAERPRARWYDQTRKGRR